MTGVHNLTGYTYTRPIKNIKKFTVGDNDLKGVLWLLIN